MERMTISRRKLLGSAAAAAALSGAARGQKGAPAGGGGGPVAISSSNGLRAVERAVHLLQQGSDPLDAAIAGVNIVEDDPADMTVGYGGVPNFDGVVQLDACVMHGPTARAGAVASLEGVKNPSKLARLVMETTDHVLLVGPGARAFADANGFARENLLTEKARKVWLYWRQNLSANDKWLEPPPDKLDPEVKAFIDQFGWDDFRKPKSGGTLHISAVDARGDLAGCTSTSGLFFKMPGRVGDSPLIGAGCFTDNEVGSAGDACVEVLRRIAQTTREPRLLDAQGRPGFGITFYALSKRGEYGSASMYDASPTGKRAQFAVADSRGARKEDCAYLFQRR